MEHNKLKDYLFQIGAVNASGRYNGSIEKEGTQINEKIKSITPYIIENTDYLQEDAGIKERVYNIIFEVQSKDRQCLYCKHETFLVSFKKGYAKYCSAKCYHNNLTNYEHWTKRASEEQKNKTFQRVVSTRKQRDGYSASQETRQRMSKSAKLSIEQKRKTCKERYGVSNPGVLGGNSSKSGRQYIERFIEHMAFDPDLCFYDDGKDNDEFWQMIVVPFKIKKKYAKYDLVVFEDKTALKERDTSRIHAVLEYNGPWHYRLEKLSVNEYDEPASPYPNSISKFESIQYDNAKREHFKHVERYYSFWESDKCLYTEM